MLFGIDSMKTKMSDRLTLIGKSLGFLVAFFETRHDKWFVLRFNDTNIERIRDYNTYMLEVDDGILTKCHYQGTTYDGVTATENGDKHE